VIITLAKAPLFGAIYGQDGRTEITSEEAAPYRDYGKALGLLVSTLSLTKQPDGDFALAAQSVKDKNQLCEDDQFSHQPAPGSCTSFLVAEDLVVTAGHCVTDNSACSRTAVVFNYDLAHHDEDSKVVAGDDVYFCKDIVAHQRESGRGLDFALIRLNRPVADVSPLPLRQYGYLEPGEDVVAMGFPNGSFAKVTLGSIVRQNPKDKPYFVANIDGFLGNSGSPVIGKGEQVEGMIVRGEKPLTEGTCSKPVMCADNRCRGEDVLKTSSFIHLIPQYKPALSVSDIRFEDANGRILKVVNPGDAVYVQAWISNRGATSIKDVAIQGKSLTLGASMDDRILSVKEILPGERIMLPRIPLTVMASVGCDTEIFFDFIVKTPTQVFASNQSLQLGKRSLEPPYTIYPNITLMDYIFPAQSFMVNVPEAPNGRKVFIGIDVEHRLPNQMKISVLSPTHNKKSVIYNHGRARSIVEFGRDPVPFETASGIYGINRESYEGIDHFSEVKEPGYWFFVFQDFGFDAAGHVNSLSIMIEKRQCPRKH
jgi:V8-like Glu-specific endopeptidase